MSEKKRSSSISSSTLYDMLIDQYQLDSHYIQTAVSDLYIAKDTTTQESLALEILLPSFSQQYKKKFVEKTETVSQLTHPNIAKIYQAGYVTPDRPYAAREFIAGYPFSERLQQLEQQDTLVNSIYALKMVRQLSDALALAEAEEIYHYYLCPEHLILKQDGTLVLVDLGIPELPGGYKKLTSPNPSHQNKEYYLSPEQRKGKTINGRSHVYTLGLILYQLLTEIPPTSPPTIWQKIRGQNEDIRQRRPDLSPSLYQLVEKCLHKEPWRRYSSLAELTTAIDEALESEALHIQSDTELHILPITKERRPLTYLLVPITLVLICITLAYTSVILFQPNLDDTLALAQQSRATLSLNPTISSATSEPTKSITNEQLPVGLQQDTSGFKINIVEPLKDQQYEIGATVVFSWTWLTKMKVGQFFTVYVADENGEKEVGQVITTNNEGVYELVVDSSSFAQDRGIYLWRVALLENEEELFASDTNMLRLIATPSSQLATLTKTSTPGTGTFAPLNTPTKRATAVPNITTTRRPTNTPRSTATATTVRSTATLIPTPTITIVLPTNSPIPPTATAVPPTSPPPPPTATAIPPTSPPPPPTSTAVPTATIPPPPPTETPRPPATATIPPPPVP